MKFIYISSAFLATIAQAQEVLFVVYTDTDCNAGPSGQFAFTISADGAPAKGDFGALQQSVKIKGLTDGYHLTMYAGLEQSGDKVQFGSGDINHCLTDTAFNSYGFYAGSV